MDAPRHQRQSRDLAKLILNDALEGRYLAPLAADAAIADCDGGVPNRIFCPFNFAHKLNLGVGAFEEAGNRADPR